MEARQYVIKARERLLERLPDADIHVSVNGQRWNLEVTLKEGSSRKKGSLSFKEERRGDQVRCGDWKVSKDSLWLRDLLKGNSEDNSEGPCECPRCGGQGWGHWRPDGGKCWLCLGTGTVTKETLRKKKGYIPKLGKSSKPGHYHTGF